MPSQRDELQRDLEGMCLQQVGSAGAEDAMARMQARRVANLEAELATCRHTIASLEMEIADVRHDLQDAEQKKGCTWLGRAGHGRALEYMASYGTAWHEVAWYGTAWHEVAWYGTAWHEVAWYGTAWHEVAWYGTAWHEGTTPALGHNPRARAPPLDPLCHPFLPTVGLNPAFSPLSLRSDMLPFLFQRTAAEEEVRFYQRQAAAALEQRDQVTLELEQLRTAKADAEARAKAEIEQLRREKASAAEKSRAEIEKLMKEKWDVLERVKEAGRHAATLAKQQELADEKIEEAERGRREADRGREEAERDREEERRERERVEREREEERRERERVEREREEERRERERVEREGKEEEGRLREAIRREREEGARLKEEVGRLMEEVERRRNGAREWEAMGRESEGQVTRAKAEAASIAAAAAAAVEAEREKGTNELSKEFLSGKDPYGASRDLYGMARDPYAEEPTEEMLSQAMREKVQALVMLAAEEERHLRDSQLVGSLRETIAGLNATLGQVTAEKVKALMQLADTAAEVQQLRDEMAALQQEVRKRDEIIARE
ncbi:unnamed protein product [Closterium sp. Yama58-4]|nr:unnamed protein product [Closterium sp. Yama58-4]